MRYPSKDTSHKANAFSTGLFDWYRRRYFEVHGEKSLSSLVLMNSIFSQLETTALFLEAPIDEHPTDNTQSYVLNADGYARLYFFIFEVVRSALYAGFH